MRWLVRPDEERIAYSPANAIFIRHHSGGGSMAFIWPEFRITHSFFLMPADLFGTDADEVRLPGQWAQFSRAERAVYPVLLSHIKFKPIATIGEERIASLAGLAKRDSAKVATDALEMRGIISIDRPVSKRQMKSYAVNRIATQREFPFYRDMIYSGIWARLGQTCPTAQSLYLALRYLAKPRPDLDEEFECWPQDKAMFDSYMVNRSEDFCLYSQKVITDHAGIARRSFYSAIDALKDIGLVGTINGRTGYMVKLGADITKRDVQPVGKTMQLLGMNVQ